MAKFKVNSTMVAALTSAGVIDGSGNITIRFPFRPAGANPDTLYELTFNASSDIVEAANERMVKAIQQLPVPAIKQNGTWIIGAPSTDKMFESVADADPNPTLDPTVDGMQVITKSERALLNMYKRKSGAAVPGGRDKATLTSWVSTAKTFFANK